MGNTSSMYYDIGYDPNPAGILAFVGVVLFISFLMIAVVMVAQWKIFVKAGMPGWYGIIPYFNTWKMFEITWGHGAYMFMLLIPFVNFVIAIMFAVKLANRFGKGTAFGLLGLCLFAPVGYMMLAFGSAEYTPL